MRKNIIFLLLVSLAHLLVLLLLFTGCTEDEMLEGNGMVPEGDGIATVQVKLDAASMLGTDDWESKIHNVRILAFSTGGPLKMNKYAEFRDGYDAQTDVIKEFIKAGLTDVVVLANETADMKAALERLDTTTTIQSVRTQIFSLSEAAALMKKDSLAANGIPMYKECKELELSNTENSPYLLKVELERILAKVTLRIQNQTHQEITLNTVTAKGLPQNSWLFPTDYAGEAQDSIQVQFNEATNGGDSASFYLPEYLLTDVSKRSYLEIRGTVIRSGVTIPCLYKISLGNEVNQYGKEAEIEEAIIKNELQAEGLHIKRNTHYEIFVSDIKGYENDKITFVVGVTPWYNVSEGFFEGGNWVHQPVSQRIALTESTQFTAKFSHSEAPFIRYEWHRRRYVQTEADKEPVEPVDEIVHTEVLPNGEISIYSIPSTVDPTASGEIYCKAAPISGRFLRESQRATLMVIGDWEGGGDAFPYMQNWIPNPTLPPGASYLLRDKRDNKVYRTKLMADKNWWMIQDIAYKNPNKELTPFEEFYNTALLSSLRPGIGALDNTFFGTCCSSNEKTGGYLYTPEAAIADSTGLITAPDNTKYQENILGVCPKGWHLPGNKDSEWGREWTVLANSITPVDVNTFSMFDYFNDQHFNAYTTTWIGMKANVDEIEYKKENTFRFHGGYFTSRGSNLSLGIKVGFDSLIIPNQQEELYIYTDPVNTIIGNYIFRAPQYAGPIRCIRDYKYN